MHTQQWCPSVNTTPLPRPFETAVKFGHTHMDYIEPLLSIEDDVEPRERCAPPRVFAQN